MLKYSFTLTVTAMTLIAFFIISIFVLMFQGMFSMPFLLTIEVLLILLEVILSFKFKKLRAELLEFKEREKTLLEKGYKKVYDNFYIDETNKRLNILGVDYGSNQILHCELNKIINPKEENTPSDFCSKLYITITIDDMKKPNIEFSLMTRPTLMVNSGEYQDALDSANKIVSYLNIIISNNNDLKFENGNVTKIEHRYVAQESADDKLRELYKLYKDGVITEYEYNIEKKQILDKEN